MMPAQPTLVYERPGQTWFEEAFMHASISQDGAWALLTTASGVVQAPLKVPDLANTPSIPEVDSSAQDAVYCGKGRVTLTGRDAAAAWHLSTGDSSRKLDIPSEARLRCSVDGGRIAYWLPSGPDNELFAGSGGEYRKFSMPGKVAAVDFVPDGVAGKRGTLYAALWEPDGTSQLVRVDIDKPGVTTIASGLDAPAYGVGSTISVSPDGESVYIALAGDGLPDNRARHQPAADRWLRIYRIDSVTGRRKLVHTSDKQDNFSPEIANGGCIGRGTPIGRRLPLCPSPAAPRKSFSAMRNIPSGALTVIASLTHLATGESRTGL